MSIKDFVGGAKISLIGKLGQKIQMVQGIQEKRNFFEKSTSSCSHTFLARTLYVHRRKLTRSKEEKLPMWRDMCMVFGIEIPETDDGDAGRKRKKPKLPDPGNIDYSKYC